MQGCRRESFSPAHLTLAPASTYKVDKTDGVFEVIDGDNSNVQKLLPAIWLEALTNEGMVSRMNAELLGDLRFALEQAVSKKRGIED